MHTTAEQNALGGFIDFVLRWTFARNAESMHVAIANSHDVRLVCPSISAFLRAFEVSEHPRGTTFAPEKLKHIQLIPRREAGRRQINHP